MSLLDFLQGASNAAASNVSGPVDLLGAGLRFMGVPVPENALMSSKWMEERGLTRKPKNALAGVLGEAAGLSAPIAAAAKAPQIAAGLLAAGDDFQAYNKALGPAGASQATVWHGSPHKFDKFDSSKIGTGEGAQAYGHGLYLAESPDVAKSYQTALSAERGFSYGGKTNLTRQEVLDLVNAKYSGYLDGVTRHSGVADFVMDDMVTGTLRADGAMPRTYKPGSERAMAYEKLRQEIQHANPGSLYKVDLPDDMIGRMLDWDRPLRDQPAVMSALKMDAGAPLEAVRDGRGWAVRNTATGEIISRNWGDEATARKFAGLGGSNAQANLTGKAYWESLVMGEKAKAVPGGPRPDGVGFVQYVKGSPARAGEALRGSGIPGIRYLDGGSRGAGGGTSNFVVFPGEENALRILERNGNPLLMP